jgi:hypothetical protein
VTEKLCPEAHWFTVATLVHTHDNALDFNVLGTCKGPWLIRVNAVMAADDSANISLQLLLCKLNEDEPSDTRRLYAVVPASHLEIPQERVLIADQIRQWIESTEGNGFLDLVSGISRGAAQA